MKIVAVLLCIVLFFEALYCFLVFTKIEPIKDLRDAFIETALSTMSHQWLAEAFLPKYMVEDLRAKDLYLRQKQAEHNSSRPTPTESVETTEQPVSESVEPTEPNVDAAEEAFYELFWEISRTSFEEYLEDHPETLDNGWEGIYINEAGLYDEGTSIYTQQGEQVLAIDVPNKLLLVRVSGTGYLGVLAIGKNPAQLRCEASEGIGYYGQTLGEIVENSGGVIGMTASGFYDPDGNGSGGIIAGYAMCEGTPYGVHYGDTGYKRIELASDNRFYICNSNTETTPDTTDAVEFSPALIIDGELMVGGFYDWNGINPRAAIGQSEYGEILMLIIEGRQVGRSIGTDTETCAKILMKHKGYTAINLDGGTSAVMYYHGEYVTRCSNRAIDSRLLPNAWVYGNYEEN
ncbi:MAG: phosphodiester glycosidase family protein [Oscillospiraceae bacterium]|nr:phosphodiester glycosidase family protein [Oscillospiraceae bacterium]